MECLKNIYVLTLVLIATLVARAEGKCSQDVPEECSCPSGQPEIMQCTCPINSNKLTVLPSASEIPSDVTSLLFLNCRFHSIDNVPYANLNSLHIRNSAVHEIQDGAFRDMYKLETLDLGENYLQNLTKETFLGLDFLKTLVITGNNLELIATSAFEYLISLEKVELSYNSGVQLPSEIFSKNLHLKSVEIRKCGFKEIPAAVMQVPSITDLSLDSNSLQALNDNAFSSLKNLNTLGLDSCAIETISDSAFDGLNQLAVLNLGHNHIKSLPPRYFEAFRDNLRYLYIESNELKTLSKDILNWDQVVDVALGHNPWICDCALHWVTEELASRHNKANVT